MHLVGVQMYLKSRIVFVFIRTPTKYVVMRPIIRPSWLPLNSAVNWPGAACALWAQWCVLPQLPYTFGRQVCMDLCYIHCPLPSLSFIINLSIGYGPEICTLRLGGWAAV